MKQYLIINFKIIFNLRNEYFIFKIRYLLFINHFIINFRIIFSFYFIVMLFDLFILKVFKIIY